MPQFKDLTGKQYGELTVIEMLHNYQNSRRMYCKCLGIDGKEYIVRQDALQSGSTKHIKGAAKAGKPSDLKDKVFGKLTALYPTDKRAQNASIIWHCRCECGNYVDVPANNLCRGHNTSCGCNKSSIHEKMIIRILEFYNISYIKEKSFDDCRNTEGNTKLFFDFYLPGFNTVIEYDGELHYETSKLFGGEEKLKKTIINDKIKDDYCKANNIRMLRIPYTKTNQEIKQIIKRIICP